MNFYTQYSDTLTEQLNTFDWSLVEHLVEAVMTVWQNEQRLFICGNGGSAGNAVHLANDFIYGVNPSGRAIDAEALSANSAVLTCLGNDLGYEHIFSHQVSVKAKSGDLLIVLSGSGNSANIVRALAQAKSQGVKTCAILGYSGGEAKALADLPIHFSVNDMQISEDLQLIVGHMLMRRLNTLITS